MPIQNEPIEQPTLPQEPRGTLAFVVDAFTPYRLHLHRRLARELRELRLASLFTHEQSNAPWALKAPAEIGVVSFGAGEPAKHGARLRNTLHEWKKGGRIIEWIRERADVRAVIVSGYNDAGRLRIINWCHRKALPVLLFGDSNVRGDRAAGMKGAVKQSLLPRVLRRVDAVLACGHLGRAYFENYGVETDHIFFFPYEPKYDEIHNLPAETIRKAAERYGINPNRRRLIFSGRLTSVKRPDLLVRAFEAIADKRPDWDLVIVGDGPMRAELETMRSAAHAPRVTWTGFLNDQAVVSALYRNADVLVLPSDYEPWAVVINEAAAAGLAIVASDVVGAAAELVVPERNGATFPAGSLDGLVNALLHVTDPARVDKYKAASSAVLNEWRQLADPVDGLRRALRHVGALQDDESTHDTGTHVLR